MHQRTRAACPSPSEVLRQASEIATMAMADAAAAEVRRCNREAFRGRGLIARLGLEVRMAVADLRYRLVTARR